jgi:DNA-binding transcriptional regulator YhcF (GntR family)
MASGNKVLFSVSREHAQPLTTQLADAVRLAIERGDYKPGDILPGFREIARETGVSMIIVRSAFKRLAAQGLVCLRRGVGTIVMAPEARGYRGHIVIASVEVRENHLISAMTGTLRQSLMMAGYLVSFVPFGKAPGTYDFSHLQSVLRTSVKLVVATSCPPELERILTESGIPWIHFGTSQRAALSIDIDCSQALADFVAACKAARVKRVLEVCVGSETARAAQALRAAGIPCQAWHIVKKGGIQEICCETLKAFYGKIAREGRSWLPDVLYFNDNFAGQSALLALVESGIDIPGDVRFVTWSNAGEGPYWRKELSRMEIDPFEAGRIFAAHVLAYLDGKRPRKVPHLPVRFRKGETF